MVRLTVARLGLRLVRLFPLDLAVRPVQLDDQFRTVAGLLVQPVDVLGHYNQKPPQGLQFDQCVQELVTMIDYVTQPFLFTDAQKGALVVSLLRRRAKELGT